MTDPPPLRRAVNLLPMRFIVSQFAKDKYTHRTAFSTKTAFGKNVKKTTPSIRERKREREREGERAHDIATTP